MVNKPAIKFYTAIDITNYILNFAINHDNPINNLQLQSILYLVQRECLGKLGRPAFSDDILAHSIGPVALEVLIEYGKNPTSFPVSKHSKIQSQEVRKIVDDIIKERIDTPSWLLCEEIRAGAWREMYDSDKMYNVIPHEIIIKEYNIARQSPPFKI